MALFVHTLIQSSAVITRSIMVRYCINNCRNWGRVSIRWCYGVSFMDICLKIDRVITALYYMLMFFLADCVFCQNTTTTTTTPSPGDIRNAAAPSNNTYGSPLSTTGNLWCYECKETYKKGFFHDNSPCSNNLSLVTLRQCGPEHRWCAVGIGLGYGKVITSTKMSVV